MMLSIFKYYISLGDKPGGSPVLIHRVHDVAVGIRMIQIPKGSSQKFPQ